VTAVLEGAVCRAFVPVRDLSVARSFYEDTLGLTVMSESPDAVLVDGHGGVRRLTEIEDFGPQPFTIVGWRVPDIEGQVDLLASRGVVFNRPAGIEQDRRGIWSAPGGGRVAWFHDPDGNTLSLTELGTGPVVLPDQP
jgi:catechol 2,3-dioxygenase-like lactoylglutathione lyase family enzyme